jgi:hypothetical protein
MNQTERARRLETNAEATDWSRSSRRPLVAGSVSSMAAQKDLALESYESPHRQRQISHRPLQ